VCCQQQQQQCSQAMEKLTSTKQIASLCGGGGMDALLKK
jgi:hypothetical protein